MRLREPRTVDATRPESRRRRRARLVRRRRRLAIAGAAALAAGAGAAAAELGDGGAGSEAAGVGAAQHAPSAGWRLVARRVEPLPAPISGEVAVADRAQLLLAGGLDGSGQSVNGVFRLDPVAGRTRPAGTLAQPIHDAAGAMLRREGLFVFGGGASTSTDAVEELGKGRSARIVGHLPTPRSDLVAAGAAGRVYVMGGYDGTRPLPQILSTSDGRRFSTVGQLPVPVRYPAVATLRGTIYLFGGEAASGRATRAVQAIDATSGRATVAGRLPQALTHASALVIGRRIYVAGGTAAGGASDRILAFDPASHRTTLAGRLPSPVTNAGAASIGGRGFLVGGLGQGGSAIRSVVSIERVPVPRDAPPRSPTSSAPATSASPSRGAPFRGRLLIADRGNNRLLVVNARKRVLWRYPGSRPKPRGGFYFPDDAFFIHGGHGIISNEEENEAIVELGYPSGRVIHSFGHPGHDRLEPRLLP